MRFRVTLKEYICHTEYVLSNILIGSVSPTLEAVLKRPVKGKLWDGRNGGALCGSSGHSSTAGDRLSNSHY